MRARTTIAPRFLLAFALSACGGNHGITTDASTDAPVTDAEDAAIDADLGTGFVIGGTAVGIVQPFVLQVTVAGKVEELVITSDGPFALRRRAPDQAMVDIKATTAQACAALPARITIAGADANLPITCDGVSEVRVVGFSVPIEFTPDGFEPTVTTYNGIRPFVFGPAEQLTATIVAQEPSVATMTINGTMATSGQPFPFAVGNPTTLAAAITGPPSFARNYQFAIAAASAPRDVVFSPSTFTGAPAFGAAVAIDGDILVIGAPNESTGASSSGAVYVFARTILAQPWGQASWSAPTMIKAPTSNASDHFGAAVAVSGDTIVVGAPGVPASSLGVVYVYRLKNGVGTREATIPDPSAHAADNFGTAVAIVGDTLAGGAPGDTNGAVYAFTRNMTTWSAPTKLPQTAVNSLLGTSLAMTSTTIAAGAPNDVVGGKAVGAAYVFVGSGASWSLQQRLPSPGTVTSGQADLFGQSIDIDGDTLVVGAPQESAVASKAGAAYVFVRNGTMWGSAATFTETPSVSNAFYGAGVGIDGAHLVIGRGGNLGAATTPAYLYRFTTSWSAAIPFTATSEAAGDEFGAAVCLDGYSIIVGAPNRGNGAVSVFR